MGAHELISVMLEVHAVVKFLWQQVHDLYLPMDAADLHPFLLYRDEDLCPKTIIENQLELSKSFRLIFSGK